MKFKVFSRRINTLNLLESRNLISQTSDSNKLRKLLETKQTIYTGFDPTAPSLHVGNLLTIMALLHFQTTGHQIITLVGGATAKTNEKNTCLDSTETNSSSLTKNINYVLQNALDYAKSRKNNNFGSRQLLNNTLWYNSLKMIDFLSTVGKKVDISKIVFRMVDLGSKR
jgi:tyrosyl-tRNA synthetase